MMRRQESPGPLSPPGDSCWPPTTWEHFSGASSPSRAPRITRAYTISGYPPAVEEYGPKRVIASARLKIPGKVVLADTCFSGWEVKVNGEARPIERYEGVFRAVALPAGEYEVEFVYAPGSVRAGIGAGSETSRTKKEGPIPT